MPKRKAKILIVDDAQINRIILCELLRNQYQILEAEDGKKALEMIKEDKKIYEAEKKQEAEQLSMFDTPLMSEKAKADYRIIGQLFETYWLIEYEDKFYHPSWKHFPSEP